MVGKLKLLVCRGNGAGTGMMIRLNVEKVMEKMGLSIQEIRHYAVSEGRPAVGQHDIVLCSKNFISMFADAEKHGTKTVGLKNVMFAKEIGEGLTAAMDKQKRISRPMQLFLYVRFVNLAKSL